MDRTDAGGVVAEGITGCGVAAGPRAAAKVGVLALAAAPGEPRGADVGERRVAAVDVAQRSVADVAEAERRSSAADRLLCRSASLAGLIEVRRSQNEASRQPRHAR